MTETVEETIEVLPVKLAVHVNSPVGIAITSLAAYGAVSVIGDARKVVTRIRETRETKKAAKHAAKAAAAAQS